LFARRKRDNALREQGESAKQTTQHSHSITASRLLQSLLQRQAGRIDPMMAAYLLALAILLAVLLAGVLK